MNLHRDIANAIQKSDKSYFFEDYGKQAQAVLAMFDSKGYVIVPKEPTEAMINAGMEAISMGKVKPEVLVKQLFTAMAASAKKK